MSEVVQVIGKALMEYKDKPGLPREWGLGHAEARAKFYLAALESAGFVIVKREADKHQIDAAYAQCGMDGPDLALMYRIMVQAAQEQK